MGSQGRTRWWTSRGRRLRCLDRWAPTLVAGQELTWERSNISMRGRSTFGTNSPGICNKRSWRWRRWWKTAFGSRRPWAVCLSRAEPYDHTPSYITLHFSNDLKLVPKISNILNSYILGRIENKELIKMGLKKQFIFLHKEYNYVARKRRHADTDTGGRHFTKTRIRVRV